MSTSDDVMTTEYEPGRGRGCDSQSVTGPVEEVSDPAGDTAAGDVNVAVKFASAAS